MRAIIMCLTLFICLHIEAQDSTRFYAGIDYNKQISGMAPSNNGIVPVLLTDAFQESVINTNSGIGAHFGMYLNGKWHLETGLRYTKISDGQWFEELDVDGIEYVEYVEYVHEEFSQLRVPLLIGRSTKADRNFRFSWRMGLNYTLLLDANSYIYYSQDDYYVSHKMDDLPRIEYTKQNAKKDSEFDAFLSYNEYYGLSGNKMAKYNLNIWYYHIETSFEFRLSKRIRTSLNFFLQAGLRRIHNTDYMAGGYNFWKEVFIVGESEQMHRNKNYGAQLKLNYAFNFKKP